MIIFIIMAILVCWRAVSYGIYLNKVKNKLGEIGMFLLSFFVLALPVLMWVRNR